MKVNFLGAAHAVTGSCYVMETGEHRFAVDCGMHQGNREIEKRNEDMAPYDASHIEFVLITHAHIDHTGLLPRLVKAGFTGPIYLTKPTSELLEIMLLDSAHIQEMEAQWKSRKRQRHGDNSVEALYTQADAEATMPLFKVVEYAKPFEPVPGITVCFKNAGHILGSAFIELEYEEDGTSTKIVFSGDLGRPDPMILKDPSHAADGADYLFLESTYGDRNHKDASGSLDELAEAVAWSYRNGQKCVIPAFAVERSQQIIYSLFQLSKQGRLPPDMPIYLDSPLAIRATEIFRRNPQFFDAETQASIKNGENPLDLPNLKFTLSRQDSVAINETAGPAVVISASGMANAGRIKHHLRHNLWRKGASVVFVGYQGVGTPGRKIVNGAKQITIFGEDVAVEAKVFTIGGFSAHAGQDELLQWLGTFTNKDLQVILTHGEPKSQEVLAKLIEERLGLKVHVPGYLEEMVLEPGRGHAPVPVAEAPRRAVDWDFLLGDAEHLYGEFRKRLEHLQERSFEEQTEVRDRLMEINRSMVELISEM